MPIKMTQKQWAERLGKYLFKNGLSEKPKMSVEQADRFVDQARRALADGVNSKEVREVIAMGQMRPAEEKPKPPPPNRFNVVFTRGQGEFLYKFIAAQQKNLNGRWKKQDDIVQGGGDGAEDARAKRRELAEHMIRFKEIKNILEKAKPTEESPMNIYVLKQINSEEYDEMQGIVVAASSHKSARAVASRYAKDEKAATWLSPATSTCNMIGKASKTIAEPSAILTDVLHG